MCFAFFFYLLTLSMVLHPGANSTKAIHKTAKGKAVVAHHMPVMDPKRKSHTVVIWLRQSTHDQHEVIDQAIVEYTRQRYCKKIRLVFGNPSPHRHGRMLFLCTLGQTFPQTNP
jgi:hypothetical protein